MKRMILWGVGGVLGLAVLVAVILLMSLPGAPEAKTPPPIPAAETAATLQALKPPKRARPVIAVIGINDATETTDYLLPYGVLKRADVAEVTAVATGDGPVKLFPALTVRPDETTAAFDARHPEGADYVIVPRMDPIDDPAALAWIQAQAEKGAIIVGVCAGALTVGEAGLLDGRRATTHWFYLNKLRKAHPEMTPAADRRFVVDGRVATTTGITASMPMALTLIEAIAGHEKAAATARELGLTGWDARHASEAFRFNRPFALTVLGNTVAFWNRETLGVELTPGMDEVTLALATDAWSRTYRSRAVTWAAAPVRTRTGLVLLPDHDAWDGVRAPDVWSRPPAQALDQTLVEIGRRYGEPTANVVAMQLEYPRG